MDIPSLEQPVQDAADAPPKQATYASCCCGNHHTAAGDPVAPPPPQYAHRRPTLYANSAKSAPHYHVHPVNADVQAASALTKVAVGIPMEDSTYAYLPGACKLCMEAHKHHHPQVDPLNSKLYSRRTSPASSATDSQDFEGPKDYTPDPLAYPVPPVESKNYPRALLPKLEEVSSDLNYPEDEDDDETVINISSGSSDKKPKKSITFKRVSTSPSPKRKPINGMLTKRKRSASLTELIFEGFLVDENEDFRKFIRKWKNAKNLVFYDCLCGRRKAVHDLKKIKTHVERIHAGTAGAGSAEDYAMSGADQDHEEPAGVVPESTSASVDPQPQPTSLCV